MGNIVSSVRVRYEPLRSIGFASILSSYVAVGTPFGNPVRILKVTNLSDKDIFVSFNGIDNHDVVPADGFFLYDYSSNKADAAGLLEQPKNDQIYVKAVSTLPSIGNVYVTVVYASQV